MVKFRKGMHMFARRWFAGWVAFGVCFAGAASAQAEILSVSGERDVSIDAFLYGNSQSQQSPASPAADHFLTTNGFNQSPGSDINLFGSYAEVQATQSSIGPLVNSISTHLSGSGSMYVELGAEYPVTDAFASAGSLYSLTFKETDPTSYASYSLFTDTYAEGAASVYVSLEDTTTNTSVAYQAGIGDQTQLVTLKAGDQYQLSANASQSSNFDGFGSASFEFSLVAEASPTPEPATLTLLGTGFVAMGGVVLRRPRRHP
jgi:PEP-CTERM motif